MSQQFIWYTAPPKYRFTFSNRNVRYRNVCPVADIQQDDLTETLINVVKNAIEAIDLRGTVVFATDPVGKQLTITDSGTGITAELSTQLFTPFFSTKKMGRG